MADSPASATHRDVSDDAIRPGTRFGVGDNEHEISEELGCGAAARVFSCKRLRTGEQLAVKVINLQRLKLLGDIQSHIDKLDREVRILRDLRHMRIVTLHHVHRTENWYFVVMERIRGGELFNQIVQHKSLSELESRYIFRQLLEGIGYMHAKRIIHRDLKPENILIVGSTPAPAPATGTLHDVKIADFGLAKLLSEGMSFAHTFVGTPQYYAPEVIKVQSHGGSYNQAADYWGLGVVLFVMLCGRYPFDGKKKPIEEQIQSASYKMDTARWKGISEDAKDLVRGLLKVDPNERLRLEQCAHHPWVSGGTDCATPLILPLLPRKLSSPMQKPKRPAPKSEENVLELPVEDVLELPEASLLGAEDDVTAVRAMTPPTNDADSRKEEVESRASSGRPNDTANEIDSRASSVQSCATLSDDFDEEEPCSEISAAARRLGKRWWAFASANCPRLYRRLIRRISCVMLVILSLMLAQRLSIAWHALREEPTSDTIPPELQGRGYMGALPELAEPDWPPEPEADESTAMERHATSSTAHEAPAREPPLVDQCRVHRLPRERVPPGMAQSIAQNIAQSMAQSMTQVQPSGSSPFPPFLEQNSSSEAKVENRTIFHLSELLKLQVSIAGSLEMAYLAFRHADPELAEATRQVSNQARDVFQLAANVVARYANVAQQVSQFVLPDLHLAVLEGEPSLAASLLDMVKSWVGGMKTDGEETRHRYSQLQAAVLSLARRAQQTKSGADRRLAVSLQVVEMESKGSESPSPPAEPGLGSDEPPECRAHGSPNGAAPSTVSLNSWTRQLFEQLTELTSRSSQSKSQGQAAGISDGGQYENFEVDDIDLAWKKDLVDLLFLAPGIAPSSLPKIEPLNFKSPAKESQVPSYEDMVVEDDIEAGSGASSGGSSQPNQTDQTDQTANAVVTYVRTEAHKSEAEFASHSAAALLRALRELKRVDGILQGCSTFWANMDGTVQTLSQMKDHTESLVKFAANSQRLRQRFEQRLEEYTNFWVSLERLCRQYCSDHQAASARMHEFIREMTDAADIIDTAESAKAGLVTGRRERQLQQNGYAMNFFKQ